MSNNHFERVTPNYEAKLISDNCFTVDNIEIKMNDTHYTVFIIY